MINEKGEEVGIIYGWYNTKNDKWYIGQTIDEEGRFKRHIDDGINKRDNTHFHRALRKYGLDNWVYCVLESNILRVNLNRKEIDWIEYYDSYYNGYNMTLGGDGRLCNKGKIAWNKGKHGIYSEETLKKLSESHKGYQHAEETKNKISEASKILWQNPEIRKKICESLKGKKSWNKGKHLSEQIKEKISQNNSRYWKGKCRSEETKKKVSESLKGKTPWNKDKNISEETKRKLSKVRSKNKLINKYDLEGNFIKQYECLYDAKKENPKCSNIYKVCIGERKQAGGFIWKYA